MASIRERRSGDGKSTYQVLFRDGGKQASKTFETKKSASDFKSLVEILGPTKAIASLGQQGGSGLTVDDLFERWMEWKATTKVTARTLRDYRRDYDNWIRPRLGHRVADTLDELDVQKWVDWMATRGLDPKSIGDRHMILGSLYRFGVARARRLVEVNPCTETQMPSKSKKAPKGFTLAQWEAMHEYGRRHEPDADDLLLFIVSTSWRFSECTPVTAAAVEDYGDTLVDGVSVPLVFVSVLGVHRRDDQNRVVYVEGEAKSRAGTRRVNLPPSAARMVRRRMVGLGVSDLLFTSPTGKQWRSSNFLNREFANILAGAGIDKAPGMGPHFLRHTHVGMLDRSKVSVSKMQRRVGHESIETTLNVYGGMIDNSLTAEELLSLDAQIEQPARGQVVSGQVVQELG